MTTVPELIASLRKTSPAVVGKLDDKVLTRLLRTTFAAVASEIAKAPDGVHKVAGLGVFRVRTVAANPEGKGGGRRVLFKAAQPKAAPVK